ncbi:ATP-sensitive inward rectifier potassium channel 15 [Pseudorasbora parva]|uniref:ATP-sensitive inward rectifier potassium channel 15 n=1 Tax=Pseudorasbora parva TaxID=51549 RepID=UPI00351DB967
MEPVRRMVSKDGHSNVKIDNVEGMAKLFLHDLWTTVVDMKWRYKITLFASTFVTTWFVFGLVFYLIGLRNGDFAPSSNHTPCVMNVGSLTGAYLFSLETQSTIGYGFRHISEECPLAIGTLVLQLVLTGLAEIFVTGAFLAKLARPKKRAGSIRFSRCAVVCRRDGRLCLMVRVANLRKSLLIQCQLSGKLVSPYITKEGQKSLVHQTSLDFHLDSSAECPFLLLPLTFCHILDERSPLTGLTADDLAKREFELLLSLNATVESTAATCQSRTSYLPQEILWDHEFIPILSDCKAGKLAANFSFFEKVQACRNQPSLHREKLQLEQEYRRE